jgi:hypothetical protein
LSSSTAIIVFVTEPTFSVVAVPAFSTFPLTSTSTPVVAEIRLDGVLLSLEVTVLEL